jgi:acylphosphatase
MMDDQHIAVRVVVSGRVQGVWFRNWTVGEAEARDLDGWVRNRRNGSVEALFSGTKALVREMIAACHEGPPLARVDQVEESAVEAPKVGSGFQQKGST